jgi:death-on-curing protein
MFGTDTRQDYVVLNYLHSQIMRGSRPGTWGQRDPKLTRAALARPYRSAFGQELYGDHFQKAAAMLDSIVNNVVFRDGNKRTALAAASLYLALNKHIVEFGAQEAEWFMYQVVVSRPSVQEIADWLQQHTRKSRLA